jgi:carboxylesterase
MLFTNKVSGDLVQTPGVYTESFDVPTSPSQDTRYLANREGSFLLHPGPCANICLFFHGFTAAPRQFLPFGKALHDAGYNILIPTLPGHGVAGHWDRHNPPPLPEDPQIYKAFGLHWLKQAQQFGDRIIIGGLSGGSTLAAWLALECPDQIDRALLFAPYLSNTNKLIDLAVQMLNIYFEWQTKPDSAHFGYEGFQMPSLRAFLELGQEVLKRAETDPAAPMLIVSSESDTAVNYHDHQALFESALQYQPKAWYHCFDTKFDIQHNMMTRAEGNQCVDLLFSIAKAYLESDLTWPEVTMIRDRIRQGDSFQQAIDQLHLKHRVSPDLVTLVTLNPT